MNKKLKWIILGNLLLAIMLISCQNPLEPKMQIGSGNEDIQRNGPFSDLKNQYMDKALEYEFSKDTIIQKRNTTDLDQMSLEEKYLLLTTIKDQSYNRDVNQDINDDIFYSTSSEELIEDVNGIVVASNDPLESVPELQENVNTPFMIEVNGSNYTKLELLDLAEQAQFAEENLSTKGRGLTKVSTAKWGNTIEYRFEASVSDNAKKMIRSAMDEWQTNANNKFTFKEITNSGWNQFIWTIGLSYHLGIYGSNSTNIGGSASLGKGAWKSFEIVEETERVCRHELGHVLGLEHEQNRYDRDNYITVNLNNVMDSDMW